MNDSPNNSNDVQSKLSIIDPSLGTYRSRYKTYMTQVTSFKPGESGLKHSFQIGCGTAVFAAIALMFFLDTGIILFALIIGVLVGWLGGQKEREFDEFLTAVRTEYLAAVKAEYAAMVEKLGQTHTKIFDEESSIGFKRLTEIIVLNRLDLDDAFKLSNDFMDFAIDQKVPSDFLNTQLLSIKLEQILDIKEVKIDNESDDDPLKDLNYNHNFIGFLNLNEDINNYYELKYQLDGVIKTVICSNKVFNHLSDYMKMEGVSKGQPKQTNAGKELKNIESTGDGAIRINIPVSIPNRPDETRLEIPKTEQVEPAEKKSNPMENLLKLQKMQQSSSSKETQEKSSTDHNEPK
jgi:hypothetical protein